MNSLCPYGHTTNSLCPYGHTTNLLGGFNPVKGQEPLHGLVPGMAMTDVGPDGQGGPIIKGHCACPADPAAVLPAGRVRRAPGDPQGQFLVRGGEGQEPARRANRS